MRIPTALQIITLYILQASVLSIDSQYQSNDLLANSSQIKNNNENHQKLSPRYHRSSTLSKRVRPGTPADSLAPLSSKVEWQKDCLDSHNYYRNFFFDVAAGKKLGRLRWDNSLAASAQAWSDKLLAKLKPKEILTAAHHSSGDYGENMNGVEGYGWKDDFTCSPGIDRYYNEVDEYYQRLSEWRQAGKPRVMSFHGIYHFTQMMWPNTTSVGCGFAVNQHSKIEVCHYYTA